MNWNHGLAWSPKFETGYEIIDNQHKTLFKLVSDLIELCQIPDNKITIGKTLFFLADYTVEHFSIEERISRKFNYPQYDAHKKMHENFTQNIVDLTRHYNKNGDSKELFSMVTKMIVKWLILHIQSEDFKIAQHIKKTAN